MCKVCAQHVSSSDWIHFNKARPGCDTQLYIRQSHRHVVRNVNVLVMEGQDGASFDTSSTSRHRPYRPLPSFRDRSAQPITHRYTTRTEDARTDSLDCVRLQYTVCVNPHTRVPRIGSCHHFQDAPTGVCVFSPVRTRPPLATTPPCCRRNHLCRPCPRRPRFHRSRLHLRHLHSR